MPQSKIRELFGKAKKCCTVKKKSLLHNVTGMREYILQIYVQKVFLKTSKQTKLKPH